MSGITRCAARQSPLGDDIRVGLTGLGLNELYGDTI